MRAGQALRVFVATDEEDAMDIVAEILSYFPDHCDALPPVLSTNDSDERSCEELDDIVPDDSNRPYDMKRIVEVILDDGNFVELQPAYAENIVIGFGRLGGNPVGIIANQPKVLAGCLDIDASVKAARFIRTCDCFNIPLISFVDVPTSSLELCKNGEELFDMVQNFSMPTRKQQYPIDSRH